MGRGQALPEHGSRAPRTRSAASKSPPTFRQTLTDLASDVGLTAKEETTAELIVLDGLTPKQIPCVRGIARSTLNKQLREVERKLGVRHWGQIVRLVSVRWNGSVETWLRAHGYL